MFTKEYQISGMTCDGCRQSVEKYLSAVAGVRSVAVDLQAGTARIESEDTIPISHFKEALPDKYEITARNVFDGATSSQTAANEPSKWRQLRPLFLIFLYLFSAGILLNYQNWDTTQFMLDFMGLFYIVFSFFKMLDLKGFPASFAMYDPLAGAIPLYGWIYPFIETALGLALLMRFRVEIALWVTLLILGTSTIGVVRTLVSKKRIQCACLGTALKLPMTQATLIENSLMLIMATMLLTKMI